MGPKALFVSFILQIKAVLLPPLGKLSHCPKTLSLITLPPGSTVNIFGRSELGSRRGEVPRPPQPFPSSARLGAGDGDIQKMRRILTLFFLVESDKAEGGDSLGSKNQVRFWYTVHPGARSGWPRL